MFNKVIDIWLENVRTTEQVLKPGQKINSLSLLSGVPLKELKKMLEKEGLKISKNYAITGKFSSDNPVVVKLRYPSEEIKKHSLWSIEDAEQYIQAGDYEGALKAFMADMFNNPFTRKRVNSPVMMFMRLALFNGRKPEPRAVMKFIYGFFTGPEWDNLYERKMAEHDYAQRRSKEEKKEEKVTAYQDKIIAEQRLGYKVIATDENFRKPK